MKLLSEHPGLADITASSTFFVTDMLCTKQLHLFKMVWGPVKTGLFRKIHPKF